MSRLAELRSTGGQSPWLDNLRRRYLHDGTLDGYLARGVLGITSNPSIFEKAIADSDDYDDQFHLLREAGAEPEQIYWELVIDDIASACDRLAPVFAATGGEDGYVSVEVDPRLAHDTQATLHAARWLDDRVDRPNVMIKVPATREGVPVIRALVAEGHNVNVTLIFSLERHAEVMAAYLDGVEDLLASGGDPSTVRSVASFFVSRVDTEVDRRLSELGGAAVGLSGRAALAQAQVAYAGFRETFTGPRWDRLADAGAAVQRPLWASTSTKNPAYPDTLYVDELVGPDTVNTLPEATLEAFDDHGRVARTVDADVAGARSALEELAAAGIDLADVATTLEVEGVKAFEDAFVGLLDALEAKAGVPG